MKLVSFTLFTIALLATASCRSTPKLVEQLQSEDPDKRAEAADALGDKGDPAAIQPLIALLAGCSNPQLKFECDENRRAEKAMRPDGDGIGSCEELRRRWERDNRPCEKAKRALVLFRESAVVHLSAALASDAGRDLKLHLIAVLVDISGPEARRAIKRGLDDKDGLVRLEVARVLGPDDLDALETLIRELRNSDRSVRLGAVELLGDFHDPRGIKALGSALRDHDSAVRDRAETMLKRARLDTDQEIRNAARKALGR